MNKSDVLILDLVSLTSDRAVMDGFQNLGRCKATEFDIEWGLIEC